jgi:hypothetical protein
VLQPACRPQQNDPVDQRVHDVRLQVAAAAPERVATAPLSGTT